MRITCLNLLTSSALGADVSPPVGPPRPSSSFSLASASSSSFWYLSRHWVAVLPTMGAIVLHCVGISFARCSSLSSSSFDHSILRMPGSSHSAHLALHCLGVFRASSDETRAHWFSPYLETEALRISSSMFVLKPTLIRFQHGNDHEIGNLPHSPFHHGHPDGLWITAQELIVATAHSTCTL